MVQLDADVIPSTWHPGATNVCTLKAAWATLGALRLSGSPLVRCGLSHQQVAPRPPLPSGGWMDERMADSQTWWRRWGEMTARRPNAIMSKLNLAAIKKHTLF